MNDPKDLDNTAHQGPSHGANPWPEPTEHLPSSDSADLHSADSQSADLGGEIPTARPISKQPFAEPTNTAHTPLTTDRTNQPILARVLSPENLQKMMGGSGLVLVIGIAAWLWTQGVFNNPVTMAIGLSTGSLLIIALGCGLTLLTRFHLAGTGLTLLGCLALPLNLWFYHSQNLINLHDGGHLWIPSAIICLVYVIVARVLKDPKIVYIFTGGVLLTGSLFLADQSIGLFWNLEYAMVFLFTVAWGLLAAFFAFPVQGSAFSREDFGKAAFSSGLSVLTIGIVFVSTFFIAPAFINFLPTFLAAAQSPYTSLWTITVLSLSAAASFITNQFLLKSRLLKAAAIIQSIQLGIVVLSFFEIPFGLLLLTTIANIFILGFTASCILGGIWEGEKRNHALAAAGTILTLLAPVQMFCFSNGIFTDWIASQWPWLNIASFGLSTASAIGVLFLLAKAQQSRPQPAFSLLSFSASIALSLSLVNIGIFLPFPIHFILPAAFLPIALSAATVIHRHNLFIANGYAAAATGSIITVAICYYFLPELSLDRSPIPLLPQPILYQGSIALFIFGIATTAASAVVRSMSYIATICYCASLGTILYIVDAPLEVTCLLPITLTAIALKLYDIALHKDTQTSTDNLNWTTTEVLLTFGLWATVLLAGFKLLGSMLGNTIDLSTVALVAAHSVVAGVQAYTSKNVIRSHANKILCGFLSTSSILLGISISEIPFEYRAEMLVAGAGLVLMGCGHWIWVSAEKKDIHLINILNVFGSLLLCGTVTISLILHRLGTDGTFATWAHEIATLVLGIGLLQLGIFTKVRASTVSGITTLSLFVLTLAVYIPIPEQMKSVSVLMMIAGGVVFGLAILLSIYRDWLLELPKKWQSKAPSKQSRVSLKN